MNAQVEYASFLEFVTAAARKPYKGKDALILGAAWAGTATFAEAHQVATHGWPEGLAAMRPLRDAILQRVSKHVQKRRMQFAVAGGAVNVGRYVSGRPDCFMTRTKVTDVRQGRGRKVLKIVVNVGARAGVTADVMFTRGAAAVALVNALEANSYRCELWMVSLAQGKNGFGGVKARIKRADEPAHLDELAFCFAHAALHRWLVFSIRTGVPSLAAALRGIGGSIDVPESERGDVYFPAATNASQWSSVGAAEAWVLDRLRDQAVAVAPA